MARIKFRPSARTHLSCSVSERSSGILTTSLAEGTWVRETFAAVFSKVKDVTLLRLRLT